MRRRWFRGGAAEQGATLVEALLVLGVAATLVSLSLPLTASVVDASRVRQAAGFVATRLRLARQQAITRSAAVGVVFDQQDGQWSFRVCVDGSGNGLRRAELDSGVDQCLEGPHQLSQLFPDVGVDVDPTLRGPDNEPGSADAVRFGRSDIASFSPAGTGTAGSLLLRSRGGLQYMVRVAGITGRTRVLRFEDAAGEWREQ